jgi:uncharacterized membrane protein YhiD involved in acid resistance
VTGEGLLALSSLMSSAVWASCVFSVAVLVDRQVTRLIANREEKDLDRRLDLAEERMNETLKSFEERLAETQQSANAAAVAVGLDPSRERRKPSQKPG